MADRKNKRSTGSKNNTAQSRYTASPSTSDRGKSYDRYGMYGGYSPYGSGTARNGYAGRTSGSYRSYTGRSYSFDSYGYNPDSMSRGSRIYSNSYGTNTSVKGRSAATRSKTVKKAVKKKGLFSGLMIGNKKKSNKKTPSKAASNSAKTNRGNARYGSTGGYGTTRGYSNPYDLDIPVMRRTSYGVAGQRTNYSTGTSRQTSHATDAARQRTNYSTAGNTGSSGKSKKTGGKKPARKNAAGSFLAEATSSIFRSAFGTGGGPQVDLKRNRSALGVYIFIAVLIIIYLVGYTISFCSKTVTNYDTVLYGSVDTPSSYNGVIIRDEKVYKSPAEGIISYEITDNSKVKKDEVVCTVRDEDTVLSMEENLDEINESIFKMQQDREDISIYSEDIERVNLQIKTLIDNCAFEFAGGDISGIYELKNSISKKMDNRNQMLLTENKGALKDLVTQREAAQDKIAQNTASIKAEEGGIVSYYTDGMEDQYTVENMDSLTKEQTQVKDKTENGFRNSVQVDDAVFKLVSSNIWYIAVYMPNEDITDWEEDDIHSLYVKDNSGIAYTLEANVQSIVDKGMEKFVLLKVSKDMEAFVNNRSIYFETSKPKTGYKIPNSAIVDETSLVIPEDYVENENTVYKVTDSGVEKITISISGRDDEKKVVYTTLNLGTLSVGDVLRSPGDLSAKYTIDETMTIKGIYVMNSGIAEFKNINMDNSISNSTHTVLDISINPYINIYDRIITDTSNITKQQKVYS